MSAVLESQPTPYLDKWERDAIRKELSRWGAFEDKRNAFNGYPSSDNVTRSTEGRGGGMQGHRILCLDWPDGMYAIHARVLALPEDLQAVVRAVHCNIVLPDGGLLDWALRVERIGVAERTARRLYSQALLRVAGII
jgi:hypothetical protein